ncbi:hypothetical protein, partial [Aerococcus loyolae]
FVYNGIESWNPPFCVFVCIFSIGFPWLFVYKKMVPMKSRWLPSTPNIIEPKKLQPSEPELIEEPVTKVSGFLTFVTLFLNLLQARGELHFRSPCKSSLRIYYVLLPMVSPLFALVALYSNLFQAQSKRPLQKKALNSLVEFVRQP